MNKIKVIITRIGFGLLAIAFGLMVGLWIGVIEAAIFKLAYR
jgi:hypothetical protein